MSTATVTLDTEQVIRHLSELLAELQEQLNAATITLQKVAELNQVPISQD